MIATLGVTSVETDVYWQLQYKTDSILVLINQCECPILELINVIEELDWENSSQEINVEILNKM